MKILKAISLILFIIPFGFSQNAKMIHGNVLSNNKPVPGVDVINITTENSTVTDSDGVFKIMAKLNDTIIFYRKNYIESRVVVTQQSESLDIELALNAIELEDVLVEKKSAPKIKMGYNEIKMTRLKALQVKQQPLGVHEGTIPSGTDFKHIFESIFAFGMKSLVKDAKKSTSQIPFDKYVAANFNDDYFIKTLRLTPNEIPKFLKFCTLDKKSNIITSELNILKIMDFMLEKNIEFKKLYQ